MENKVNEPKLHEADMEVFRAAATGEGCIPLTPELLKELKEAAIKTTDTFEGIAASLITNKVEAERIKEWRCGPNGGTWRYVAACAHAHYHSKEYNYVDWYPASNQLMGMALCNAAQDFLGEDQEKDWWN